MKIKGKRLELPEPKTLVIPKGDDQIVFKIQMIASYDDFDKLCPLPIAPEVIRKGGERFRDVNDKKYRQDLTNWSVNKTAWMALKSLEATPELEWETVEPNKPETWKNYLKELKDSGFSDLEIGKIVDAVIEVNGLSEDKIEKATKAFLAGQVVPPESL